MRNIGVQPLLDAVTRYLPSPLDAAKTVGVNTRTGESIALEPDAAAPLAALVFKVTVENARKLAFVRVYSGTMRSGDACRNVTTGEHEKIGRMFRLQAVGGANSLKTPLPGKLLPSRLCAPCGREIPLAAESRPVLLENIDAYTPVISLRWSRKIPRRARPSTKPWPVFAWRTPR